MQTTASFSLYLPTRPHFCQNYYNAKKAHLATSTRDISRPIPSLVRTRSDINFIRVSRFSLSLEIKLYFKLDNILPSLTCVGSPWMRRLLSLFLLISPTCVEISVTFLVMFSIALRNPAISLEIILFRSQIRKRFCHLVELAMSQLIKVFTCDFKSSRFCETESWTDSISSLTFS